MLGINGFEEMRTKQCVHIRGCEAKRWVWTGLLLSGRE